MKKTKSAFYLYKNGLVVCSCGSILDFAEDLVNCVCPILWYDITVEFLDVRFTVNKYDCVESIKDKYFNAMGW